MRTAASNITTKVMSCARFRTSPTSASATGGRGSRAAATGRGEARAGEQEPAEQGPHHQPEAAEAVEHQRQPERPSPTPERADHDQHQEHQPDQTFDHEASDGDGTRHLRDPLRLAG